MDQRLARQMRGVAFEIMLEGFGRIAFPALIIILIIAAAVSALLGEVLDAAVIFSIVVLSTLLGFLQEYRASQALEALKRMAAPAANIVRDGQQQKIPAREIVPGDIVLLSAGGHVPADGRVIETYNLKINESAFTGESAPVDKQTDPLPPELPLAERANMLFAGTTVIGGRGVAAVAATGMRTEFGKIAHLVQTGDGRHTPLRQDRNAHQERDDCQASLAGRARHRGKRRRLRS